MLYIVILLQVYAMMTVGANEFVLYVVGKKWDL